MIAKETAKPLFRYGFSTNHKEIGTSYLIFGGFSGILGTVLSILIRVQLASPHNKLFKNLSKFIYHANAIRFFQYFIVGDITNNKEGITKTIEDYKVFINILYS